MKKLLIAAAMVAAAGGAQAADLAVKAAPYVKAPVPPPVYDWTGFYIGINAGDGFNRSYTQLGGLGGNAQSRLGGVGGEVGGQIGYNWQYGSFLGLGNVVFGVETDIQGANFDDNYTCPYACAVGLHQKLDWFGTARARVGLATGPVLTYFTGGFAYGGVNTSLTGGGVTSSFNNTRTGYALGSGVEAALGGNWTGRIEYLYLNLGAQSGAFTIGPGEPFRSEITANVFRVGLNYRMGEHAMYVAEPLANWNGFYLGGNLGGAYSLNRSSINNPGNFYEQFNFSSTTGFMGGGQIGWNVQSSAWVFGVEGDFQASAQKDNKVCEVICSAISYAAMTQKMDWLGTARVRAGYSLGRTLFYVTGGWAYGDVKTSVVSSAIPVSGEYDHKLSGYAVGGGIESPFTFLGLFGPGWTAKTEYLYVDLGKASDIDITGTILTTRVQEQILRTGLNYHFNQPVVARY